MAPVLALVALVACKGEAPDTDRPDTDLHVDTDAEDTADTARADTDTDPPDTDVVDTDTDVVDTDTGQGDAWTAAELDAALQADCAGLWFTSESDYPLVPVSLPGAFPVDATTIVDAVRPIYVNRPYEPTLDERMVEVRGLEWFFDPYVVAQDWWSDYEYTRADLWKPCRAVFDHTLDPQVFRLGDPAYAPPMEGAIDVYVVGGSADGALVGVWTISVET